ncbi:unnamed protein product [Tilletia laevis]|uniref:HIT domain-containing protein n=2 Tax=Tilletia TaxID=13289 RepID=A0A177VBS1_9BASI|nr:hypothetical protein CF336_g3153 [Tilletia laevis]KAE8262690.1 hypothetical protein A4X03_0g2257 [Tilletia caries]KAE8205374.1 hypothetical protein CF335_g2319 [Tilletia laevis]CAD6888162.1 unnamed protein product [Tilletia caries]CAD6896875.1 unnamed protein product [Tilletia caries]
MTSHTLAAFRTDESRAHDGQDEDCTFCAIARNYPHQSSQASTSTSTSASASPSAYVTYSDPSTFAILDILPIRRGHTLVIPRKHVRQLSDLGLDDAAAFARALVLVTRMVGKALGDDRLQVITNQVYAQVVPHLHFHIVPAPPLPGSTPRNPSPSQGSSQTPLFRGASPESISLLRAFGHGRDELEDDDADTLVRQMRDALPIVLKEAEQEDAEHRKKTSKL